VCVCKNNNPANPKPLTPIVCAVRFPFVQSLFPGLWLTEITADAYKVPDE